MSVRVYLSGNPEHDRVLQAFYDGCGAANKVLTDLANYEPSDVAVIFGMRKSQVPLSWPRGEVFQRQRDNNLNVVVLETGYINRGGGEHHHYAAGINGLNGRADFRNKGMSDLRAQALRSVAYGLELKPWREYGRNVILCGQVPWDASVDGTEHVRWLGLTAGKLMETVDRPIIFRPHPLGPKFTIPGTIQSTNRPLDADLHQDGGAHAVVTFNSNSAVEALLEGVPVYAEDAGSMAYGMGAATLADLAQPAMPDRLQWLADLAYAQWTPAEMREGKAWAHLFR